jgi:hypothetical protein
MYYHRLSNCSSASILPEAFNGVQDIQLYPVKKLLFINLTDLQLRDEVAVRLQAGLVWPAYDTTMTGWSMTKPVKFHMCLLSYSSKIK